MKKISVLLLAALAGSLFGWEFEFKNMAPPTYSGVHAILNSNDKKNLGIGERKAWEKVKMKAEGDAMVIDTRESIDDAGKYLAPHISIRAVKPADLKLGNQFKVQTSLEISSENNQGNCLLRYWGPVKDAPAANLRKAFPVDGKTLVWAESLPEALQSLEVNVHFDKPGVYTLKKITVESVPVEK